MVLALLSGGATVYLATKDQPYWTGLSFLFPVAVVISAWVGPLEEIRKAISQHRGERGLGLSNRIDEVLRGGLIDVVERAGLDWGTVGIHVGVNAFSLRWRWGTWCRPWPRRELVRVGRARVSSTSSSGVRWTKGKGVIGRCWSQNLDAGRNQEQDYASLREASATTWMAQKAAFRDNLSFEEFRRIRHYGAVVATPIRNSRGKFVGCISVDAPGDCYPKLKGDIVRHRLQGTARLAWLVMAKGR